MNTIKTAIRNLSMNINIKTLAVECKDKKTAFYVTIKEELYQCHNLLNEEDI